MFLSKVGWHVRRHRSFSLSLKKCSWSTCCVSFSCAAKWPSHACRHFLFLASSPSPSWDAGPGSRALQYDLVGHRIFFSAFFGLQLGTLWPLPCCVASTGLKECGTGPHCAWGTLDREWMLDWSKANFLETVLQRNVFWVHHFSGTQYVKAYAFPCLFLILKKRKFSFSVSLGWRDYPDIERQLSHVIFFF